MAESSFRKRWTLVALAALASLGGAGCRSLETLKQRCIAGEQAACEQACAKGVSGEGGCFHAGHLRRAAASDPAGEDARRAAEYYRKACEGGFGDGCLFEAQLIEAPYASLDLDGSGTEPPKLISDVEVLERERLLGLACDRGSVAGCKRRGDVLIGKDTAAALAAYQKACEGGADPTACKAARAHETDVAERLRLVCTSHGADACASLGAILFAVDPPRAVRLFASECELRGVAALHGGVAGFVRERWRMAADGRLGSTVEVPTPATPAPEPTVLVAGVQGAVAIIEVERQVRQQAARLGACLALAPAGTREATVELTIDVSGDGYRSRVVSPAVGPACGACVDAALTTILVTPPPAVTVVTLKLSIPEPPAAGGTTPPPRR